MARPKLDIDADHVFKLAQLQCTTVEIAAFFGCDEGTIRKRFSEILTKGRESGKTSLRRMQWKAAESGNNSMLIWLGKQYLGQVDRVEKDISKEVSNTITIIRAKKPDADSTD